MCHEIITFPPDFLRQLPHCTVTADDIPAAAGLAWWQDYRLYSGVLLALATALVAVHW